jgi:hypothetical protein
LALALENGDHTTEAHFDKPETPIQDVYMGVSSKRGTPNTENRAGLKLLRIKVKNRSAFVKADRRNIRNNRVKNSSKKTHRP